MCRLLTVAILLAAQAAPQAAAAQETPTHAPTHTATHYGTSYNGQRMGCSGIYTSANTAILAVPPNMYHVPCGTPYMVVGPNGTIQVTRTDSCPGCGNYTPNRIDLSEAGITVVCGGLYNCAVALVPITQTQQEAQDGHEQ